ncbi:DeoR/GlpR family DNA-binding transcription regulator [Cohaesibacter marisflavi]|nr:DeoR/GlpR family DNA-binding transcription regulator [Cohaesibacter marisflavi]
MTMQSRRKTRLDKLEKTLDEGRALHLRDAASMLGVSEMTVRRDIASSDERFSFLGGHIVISGEQPSGKGYFLHRENATNVQAKKASCQKAIDLIQPGDVVFLDCGTTLPYIAESLGDRGPLTVICYSVNIAEIVCKQPNLKVILLGGEYHPSSASFASEEALVMLSNLGINKAFLSAGGLHAQHGLSCSNFHEVRIKQMAMSRAVTNILVMDSSKIGKVKAAPFAPSNAIDFLATDDDISTEQRSLLMDANVELVP